MLDLHVRSRPIAVGITEASWRLEVVGGGARERDGRLQELGARAGQRDGRPKMTALLTGDGHSASTFLLARRSA